MKALLLALLVALGAAAWQTHRLSREEGAHASTKNEFSEYRERAEANARQAETKQRTTEQELTDANHKIDQQAMQILEAQGGKARADRERAAAERMRDAADQAASAARRQCAAGAAPGYSTPGADPIGVLADVLRRADGRAGELAGIADDRRVRGLACEAAYDTAREAVKN